MRRVLTTAIVLLVTLVLAAPAAAVTPTERRLAQQIKVLQKQIKTLKKQVVVAHDLGLLGVFMAGCSAAATADAFQGTWKTIETFDKTGTSQYGAQQPVNDYGLGCKQIAVNRASGIATVAVFQSILNIFKP